jgi:AraC-like DNA-binding protein
MAVGAMGYGADVEIDPGTLEEFYLLMLPYAGDASIQHGGQHADTSAACGSVLNPEDATLMQWSADCSKFMVRIDRLALERQLSIMLGGAPVPSIRFDLAMPMAGGTAQWWRMLNLLVESLDGPGAMPNSLATSLHESLLLVSLLDCQPNCYTHRLGQSQKSIAPRHVRQVEAYIEEHAEQPLTVADLIAVSGVSARALFDGFRRFRDTSPLAYLRSVRLRRVRQQLLQAGEDETVTAVATQWGFYQLGRFAAQYKAAYGEAPSETLRRL